MGVVSYVSTEEAPDAVRSIFDGMQQKLGVVPNVFRTMAHSPEMLQAFLGLNATLAKTQLDGKLRELAYIKTSQLNDCEYCLHHHKGFGRKAGLSERQINEVNNFETSDAYDDLQRDVLQYAEEVTRHVEASEDLFSRLKAKLSEREIVELAMTVAIANLTNRVTETLKVELP